MRSRSLLINHKADAILLLREGRHRQQQLRRGDGDGIDQDTPHLNRLIRILVDSDEENCDFDNENENENENETRESPTRAGTRTTISPSISTMPALETNTSSNPELQFWSSPMASNQNHKSDDDAEVNLNKVTPVGNDDGKIIDTVTFANGDEDCPVQKNSYSDCDGREEFSQVDKQKETAAVPSPRTKIDYKTVVYESPWLLSLVLLIRRRANRRRIANEACWKTIGHRHLKLPKCLTNDLLSGLYRTVLGRAIERCRVRNSSKVGARRLEELSRINRYRTFSGGIRDSNSNDKNSNETESISFSTLIGRRDGGFMSPCRSNALGSQRIRLDALVTLRGTSNSFKRRKGNRNQRLLTTAEKVVSSQKLWETAFLTVAALCVYEQQKQYQKEQAIAVDSDYNDSLGNSHQKRGTEEEEFRSSEALQTKDTTMYSTNGNKTEDEDKNKFPTIVGRGYGHIDNFEHHHHEWQNNRQQQHQFSRGDKQEILFLENYHSRPKDYAGRNGTKRTPSVTEQEVLQSVQTTPKISREEKRFISLKDIKSTNCYEISNDGGSIKNDIGKNENKRPTSLVQQNKGKSVPPTLSRRKEEERPKSKDTTATNSSEIQNDGDKPKNNLCNHSTSKQQQPLTHYPKESQLQTCKSKEFLLLQRFGLLPKKENRTDSESSLTPPTKSRRVHGNDDQASQLHKDGIPIGTPPVSHNHGRVGGGEHGDENSGKVNGDSNESILDKTDSDEPVDVDNTGYSSPIEFPVCLDYYEEDEDDDDDIQSGVDGHSCSPFEKTTESCDLKAMNFTYATTDSSTTDSSTTDSSKKEKRERKRKRSLALEDIRLRKKRKRSKKKKEKKMSNNQAKWGANDCLGGNRDKKKEGDNLETPRKLKIKDYSVVEAPGIDSDSKGFVDISNRSYEHSHCCKYQAQQDASDSLYDGGDDQEVGDKLETPRKLKIKDYSMVEASENESDSKGFVDIADQSYEKFHSCEHQAKQDWSESFDGDGDEQEEGGKLETPRKLKMKDYSLVEALGNESDFSNDFIHVASQSNVSCKHQAQQDLVDSLDGDGDKKEGGDKLETPRKLKIKDLFGVKALVNERDFTNRNLERCHGSDKEWRISTNSCDPNDEISNSPLLELKDSELCMDDGKAYEDPFSVPHDDFLRATNAYLDTAVDGQNQAPMRSAMDSVHCMENGLTSDDPFSVSREVNPQATACHGAASYRQQQAAIRLLCSESFLENFGDVIAEVVRGDSIVGNNGEPSDVRNRPIQFIDTDLVDECSVDIETPSRGAMVVSALSRIQASGGIMEVFLPRIVELAATSRYDRLAIFVCVDAELDYAATRDLVRLQTAFLTYGIPKTQTSVQWASKRSLSSCIAQTTYLFIESGGGLPSCALSNTDYWLSDSRTCQRLKFLLSIIPTLSVSGALHWLDLCVGDLGPTRCPSRVAAQNCAELGDKSAKWFQRCFRHVETESKLLESYLLRSTANTELELWNSMNQSVPKQLVEVVRARLNRI